MTQNPETPLGDIIRRAEAGGARIGLVLSRDGTVLFGHRAQERFLSASVVKIAIMVEIYRAADAGRLRLEAPVTVTAPMMAKGSGVMNRLVPGYTVQVQDLLYLMMAISDNTATNLLIDRAGMAAVNATMAELGMAGSNLGRPMLGRPATADEIENIAIPMDYDRLMQAILDGRAASQGACAAMLDLLRAQQNERRLARHLPAGADWGSKTGTLDRVVNDAGFLRTADGTACLSMFTQGFARMVDAEEVLGDMAQAAFRMAGLLDGGSR